MNPITVFLLDDSAEVRSALAAKLAFESDIVVVGEAESAAEALKLVPEIRPQVAILDVRLPDGSGIDVCRRLRSDSPELACFMLTSYDDEDALLAAVMAGAAGFLLKAIHADVAAAIRKVATGESMLDPCLTRQLLDSVRSRLVDTDEHQVLTLIESGLTDFQIGAELAMPVPAVRKVVERTLARLGVGRWFR